MRILHIDDSPDDREIVKLSLEGIDPEMDIASSASPSESLRMMEELQIDCIVCDYIMPEMNGIELCRRIRETSDIPFIMYTGRGSEDVASIAFEAGADDYIRKEPGQGHYRVLANRVRQAVEKHWGDGLYRNVLENTRDSIIIAHGTRIVYANQATADLVGVSSVRELLETDALDWILKKDRRRIQSIVLGRQRGEPQPPRFEIEFQRSDGERRVLEVSSSLIHNKGRPASLSVVRDVSDKVRVRERLAALHNCTIRLASAESIEEIAKQTLDSIEEVFDFRWGDFSILEAGRLVPVHFKGIAYEDFEILDLDGLGVIVRAARTGESQLVPDTRVDEDYLPTLIGDNVTTLSELAVPIKHDDNVIGVINLESPVLNGFSADDQRLLEIFSQYVASAVVRIRNEDLLKASEEKYRNILESSLDGVTVTKDTKIVFANQSFAEMIGCEDPSELLGKSSWDVVAPEFHALIQERGNKRREGDRSTFRCDMNFVGKDGAPFYVESQTSAIEFEGEPAVLGVHRDINERKRLDAELRDSEARWRSLVALAPDGIITFNPLGFVTSINDVFEELTGFSKDEIVGKHVTKMGTLRARDMPKYVRLFSSLIRGQTPPPLDFEYRRKDGSMGWGQAHMRSIKVGDTSREILMILRETSEHKRLEKEHLLYDERLESLYRHVAELAHTNSLEEVAEVTLDSIIDVFDYQWACFCLVDGGSLRFTHSRGFIPEEEVVLPLDGKGITVRAVRTGRSQLVGDVKSDKDYLVGPFTEKSFQSELDVPINVHGDVVAVLNVESEGKDRFTKQDLKLLEIYAEHVSSAISRIRRGDQLKKSEEKYRELMESSLDAVTVSTDNKIVYSNRLSLEMLGYDNLTELKGMRFLDLVHPEDQETAKEVYESRSKGERGLINYTVRVRGKDGQYKYIESRTNGIEYEGQEAIISIARDITERKRLEEELRESEERHRTLVELSPQGIMVIDSEGYVRTANPAVENLHGFSSREILGKHFTELPYLDKEDLPRHRERFKAIMGGTSQLNYEYKLTHKDGTERWAVANIGVLKNKGRIDGFLTVINDITERKLMEEALRVNQERFQAFMESAPVTLTIYDSDLNYIDANQNLLDLYGYTREFLIGRNMEDLHPDTVETGRSKLYRNVIRTGEPLFLPEVRSPNKLGDRVFSIWAFKVGEGMGLISTEITENKNYEYKLRESEEKYRGLFDLSPFAIVISDMKGRITDVNDAVIRMAGFPRDELIGKHFSKLPVLSKRDIPRYLKIFSSFLSGKPLGPLEIPVHDKDGTTGILEIHVNFVETEGEKTGIQAIFKDITPQKETEEELRRSEERYRSLIELAPEGIMTLNLKGVVTSINTAYMKLTGHSENEIVGQHFTKLQTAVSLKDMPKYIKMFTAMLRGKTPPLVEFEYKRKDGTLCRGEAMSQIAEIEPGKREVLTILRDITDRKRMEEELRTHSERLEELISERTSELRESEERFRNVIDNLPMGVHMYKIDAHGDLRLVATNPLANEMLSIPSSAYISKTIDEGFPPLTDTEIPGRFKEIAEKGGFWHEENIRCEGDRIIGALDNYNFQTSPGEMASVFRDVTEQKRMEEALKASEAKYRSFLEEGLDGVVVTWKGEYLYVNQRYAEMLGYSDPSELLGRNTREVIYPRDAERLDAIIEQRQSGDMQRLLYEVRSLKKDGSSIWVEVASSGIEFEGNQAVITYARDITERKQMEEEIRSLARFPGESTNPVLRISEDGVIMYTNSAAELVLAEWKTKVGMKAPEEWIRYVSTALEEGMQEIEMKISDRVLSMRLMPIEDAGYVNVYSRDVTDQKQMAESLLTAERLAVVGRISAMMGHDLRGPLVVIRNAVDLARKKPERTDKVLEMIERSAGQAMDLLEELRTRTREDPVSLAPVELGELLRKTTENILLPEGVELRLEIDDTLPELVLDEAKTMRVLDNVIRNAFDAMPAGGVLKIGATREGDKVVIRVSDTGPGIPEDTLRNLFKPFYTTKPGGLGLGLTSTKHMMDIQGGTISVETSDGEGATFAIALPLKEKNPGQ